MLQEWQDRDDNWERDSRMRRWLRDQGVTPYEEVRKWRRRFWTLFALVAGSVAAAVIAMTWPRAG
jgi:hypothetical protein